MSSYIDYAGSEPSQVTSFSGSASVENSFVTHRIVALCGSIFVYVDALLFAVRPWRGQKNRNKEGLKSFPAPAVLESGERN